MVMFNTVTTKDH